MEFLQLKKDDIVKYIGIAPYIMSNGQRVEVGDDNLIIHSNVVVQKKFFELKKQEVKKIEEPKQEETKVLKLEDMNKEQLIQYADENNIDVDKRKGEAKILEEIKSALKK